MTTTDHIYELHSAIVAALGGDATLASLVNGVYGNVPAEAKFPYVAVDAVAASDSSTRTTDGWQITLTIRALSRSRRNQEALNLLAEIRRILDGAALAPTGCTVTAINEVDSSISRLADRQTLQGSISFVVRMQEGSAFVGDGNNFLLKIGNGASPTESFTTIGGLRDASISLENRLPDASNLYAGKWRTLCSGGGIAAVSLSGKGYFTDSAAEERLRSLAFSGVSNNFEVILGSNDKISGAFMVAAYKRSSQQNSNEEFDIAMESNGLVTFTAG